MARPRAAKAGPRGLSRREETQHWQDFAYLAARNMLPQKVGLSAASCCSILWKSLLLSFKVVTRTEYIPIKRAVVKPHGKGQQVCSLIRYQDALVISVSPLRGLKEVGKGSQVVSFVKNLGFMHAIDNRSFATFRLVATGWTLPVICRFPFFYVDDQSQAKRHWSCCISFCFTSINNSWNTAMAFSICREMCIGHCLENSQPTVFSISGNAHKTCYNYLRGRIIEHLPSLLADSIIWPPGLEKFPGSITAVRGKLYMTTHFHDKDFRMDIRDLLNWSIGYWRTLKSSSASLWLTVQYSLGLRM